MASCSEACRNTSFVFFLFYEITSLVLPGKFLHSLILQTNFTNTRRIRGASINTPESLSPRNINRIPRNTMQSNNKT